MLTLTLTQEAVRARSKTFKGALDVSKQHWQEIATASDADLNRTSKTLICVKYCGLCQHYKRIRRSSYCLLCPCCCAIGSIWHEAYVAYNIQYWDKLRECAAQIVIDLERIEHEDLETGTNSTR